MRRTLSMLLGVLSTLALSAGLQPAHAAPLTFFMDRSTFNASAPGLPLETFESGLWGTGGLMPCPDPLSDGNEQGCFPAGSLKPGISYSGDGTGDPGLVGVGAGILGSNSKSLVANYFEESFEMDFPVPTNTAGFDLVSFFNDQTCTVKVFDAAGQKGSATSACGPTGDAFLGVQSDTLITKIVITASNTMEDGAEGVDNVVFGFVNFTAVTANPAILDTSGPTVHLNLSATLTDMGGAPIAGRQIHFAIDGDESCVGTTDASGFASCGNPTTVAGVALSSTMTYSATFQGAPGMAPSTGSAGLIA